MFTNNYCCWSMNEKLEMSPHTCFIFHCVLLSLSPSLYEKNKKALKCQNFYEFFSFFLRENNFFIHIRHCFHHEWTVSYPYPPSFSLNEFLWMKNFLIFSFFLLFIRFKNFFIPKLTQTTSIKILKKMSILTCLLKDHQTQITCIMLSLLFSIWGKCSWWFNNTYSHDMAKK